MYFLYRVVHRKYIRINVVYDDDRSRVYRVHVVYKPFKWYRFCDWVLRNIRARVVFVQL